MNSEILNVKIEDRSIRNLKKRIKRKKEIRRKVILFFLFIFFVCAMIIPFHTLVSNASSEIEDISVKYFTCIMVEYGDTLYDIADQYQDDEFYSTHEILIDEIKSINHLTSDEIKAGQYIIVPYYATWEPTL